MAQARRGHAASVAPARAGPPQARGAHHIGRDLVGAQHAEPELRDAGGRGAAAGRLAGAGRDRLRRRLLLALHDLGARLVQRRCARARARAASAAAARAHMPRALAALAPTGAASLPCSAPARFSRSGAAAAAPCAGRAGSMPQGTPSADNVTSGACKLAAAAPPPSRQMLRAFLQQRCPQWRLSALARHLPT
jgi:hypothetical protein